MSGRHGVVQHANFFIIKTSKSGPVQLCLWINVLDHADHLEMFSLLKFHSSCGTMNVSANTCNMAWFIGGLVRRLLVKS
jgi:hypothetical protein